MAEDLIETLKGVGDTIKSGSLALKNMSAPEGPGQSAPPLGQDASGGAVRYNKDGSPPTPVNKDGSEREVKVVGEDVKKESFP
jgi:hypothetical protein